MNIGDLADGGSWFVLAWVLHYLLTKIIPAQIKASDGLKKEVAQLRAMLITHHDIVKKNQDPHLVKPEEEDDET